MKNSLNYLKLWQQKRDELPVKDSAQADWLEMQSLLDLHLPSSPHNHVPQSDKALQASKIIKVAKGFKAFILLLSTTAAIVAGVYTYNHLGKTKHGQPDIRQKKQVRGMTADSLKTIDSLKQAESAAYNIDSLSQINSSLANTDNATNDNQPESGSTDKNAPGNTSTVRNVKVGEYAGRSVLNKNSSPHIIMNSGKTSGGRSNSHNNIVTPVNSHRHIIHNAPASNTGNQARHGRAGISPAGYQTALTAGGGYQQLVLSAYAQTSSYLVAGVDSIQSDVNNYFSQPAINSFLYPNARPNGAAPGQVSATVNDIAGKISKSSAAMLKRKGDQKPKNDKQEKAAKIKSSSSINLDWGLLTGANTSGSFTPKKQNSNFYGSLPVDLNLGLYGTYHFNDKWAINVQAKAFNPQNVSGSYSHANAAKADSGAIDSGKAIRVTDSRKAYFVSVPIHLVYKLNNYISIKGGPVINIPVKQLAGTTGFTPLAVKKDTPYYTSVTNQLKNTRYVPSINFGLSAGVSLQYNRLSFEATYLKSISGYKVTSDFGSYKSYPGTIQLSIGFQLNKPKNK